MDLLPRYHLVGYSGTALHLTIRYRVLYLQQATPYTGHSQSVRWLLLNMMLQTINRQIQGAPPPAGYTLYRALTICEVAAP